MHVHENSRFRNIATLALVGVLSGVIVAAAAFPLAAASGLIAKAGAISFDELPASFTVKQAPQATQVLARDGKTPLATFFDENRKDVPLTAIAPTVAQALVAAEDQAFYRHNGVDVRGLARAVVVNKATGAQQGGSTLTMQLVRMLATYSATDPQQVVEATEKSTSRKIKESRQALALDKELGKKGVIERYLNLAPYGHSTYGIYAASMYYFGKTPDKLSLSESALLAGVIRAPSVYDPMDEGQRPQTMERRDWVLDQMVKTGAITTAQATAAKAVELKFVGKTPSNGCTATKPNNYGFFCDYFQRWWLQQEAFGSTTYDRERRLRGGGYRVITSLDPVAQNAAFKNVTDQLGVNHKEALMVAAVEPGTGKVRALATNRTFGIDGGSKPKNKPHSNPAEAERGVRGTYPITTNPLITGGGGVQGYQAGSTFKIFAAVAALQKGMPLATEMNAPQVYRSGYYAPQGEPGSCSDIPRYCPTNDNSSMAGQHDMWSAFGASVNTYFVPLEEQAGAYNTIQAAKALGIRFLAPSEAEHAANKEQADTWGSFVLGVSATTPLDLANAYATLAADGSHCDPTPVEQIFDFEGGKIDAGAPHCDKAVSTEVARGAIDMARCPVGDQSAFDQCRGATARTVRDEVGHPVAGKTGTTDSNRTASLVVTTTTLAVAGIMADPDWPETPENMDHNKINPAVYETLADAMKGKPKVDFPAPARSTAYGDQKTIPNVSCRSVEDARNTLEEAGFNVKVDDIQVSSNCPQGSVAYSEPNRRSVEGATITLKISAGSPPPNRPSNGPDGQDDGDQPNNDISPDNVIDRIFN
ncbi:carboxypeptidase [Asanoa ishikariensis]|uniref:Membrane carboxypeptidase (Penicillin-binding protein) n=1 Tax=Asanoa ishikariensis TaxID=137265 RepID=A0A1H3N3E4_9ACTN|nr:penicillin-binding protein [Asanoa ishikariensis]GIF68874.1 carboxypeptidase [Asanoa ishikariensis]SDY83457.1 Membrane carboxypeptidase (penicillin-binding protein) [Asanoa ishikariensis]